MLEAMWEKIICYQKNKEKTNQKTSSNQFESESLLLKTVQETTLSALEKKVEDYLAKLLNFVI